MLSVEVSRNVGECGRLKALWESPTAMGWLSHACQIGGTGIVLLSALRAFSPEQITVWQMLLIILGLNVLADMGFTATFARMAAYAMGGAKSIPIDNRLPQSSGSADLLLLSRITSTAKVIFSRITIAVIVFWAVVGTALLIKPIGHLENPQDAWLAWAATLVGLASTCYAGQFVAFLQGVEEFARWRRVQALCAGMGWLTAFVLVTLVPNLLLLVLGQMSWRVMYVLLVRRTSRRAKGGLQAQLTPGGLHRETMQAVWPRVWRSAIGIWASAGIVHGTGLFYAQVESEPSVASYLLAVQILSVVNQFSAVPFQNRIPAMARLQTQGRIESLIATAVRGMVQCYWVFVASAIVVAIAGPWILDHIASQTPFVSQDLWLLLCLSFLVQRYGAMHLQLYTTTNRVIWHIANGVTGLIQLAAIAALFGWLGVYAFPVAFLCGNLGFYAWYSAVHSYRTFPIRFWEFEWRTAARPAMVFLAYAAVTILVGRAA